MPKEKLEKRARLLADSVQHTLHWSANPEPILIKDILTAFNEILADSDARVKELEDRIVGCAGRIVGRRVFCVWCGLEETATGEKHRGKCIRGQIQARREAKNNG